jgi:hypothetical protein
MIFSPFSAMARMISREYKGRKSDDMKELKGHIVTRNKGEDEDTKTTY